MNKIFFFAFFVVVFVSASFAQGGGMALGPARFELEMNPGTEKTVVVNLDYKVGDENTKPLRILASLNDWTLSRDGRVDFFPPNTRPNSASSWLIYSPGEATVTPGVMHQIRVTVSVPANATPGDHLAALIIEQRPDTIKYAPGTRQIVVRFRLASVFYVKVGNLSRKGDFADLIAETTDTGVVVTPTLKNQGNSVIRPTASAKIFDAEGKPVAESPDSELGPILAGAESVQPLKIDANLAEGKYSVKYRIDFQDGQAPTEGVTDLVVKPQIARANSTQKKP